MKMVKETRLSMDNKRLGFNSDFFFFNGMMCRGFCLKMSCSDPDFTV